MNKYFYSIIIVLALVILPFIPVANASDAQTMLSYGVINTDSTSANATISAAVFTAGKHRLLGYTVAPITSGSGTVGAGLFDGDATDDITAANMLGESNGANTTSQEVWFPQPVGVSAGMVYSLGGLSTLCIYYEKTTP